MQIDLKSLPKWKSEINPQNGSSIAYFAKTDLTDIFEKLTSSSLQEVFLDTEKHLNTLNAFHAAIIETSTFILAWTDHIASIPIFYGKDFVSNHLSFNSSDDYEADKVTEFLACGYNTNNQTLKKGAFQLRAGEYLIFDKQNKQFTTKFYYRYVPALLERKKIFTNQQICELERVTDRCYERLISYAKGRKIWVPLSAGLDSRLVLAKLVEKGYDNLETFSYGMKGNGEMKTAQAIAKRLDVKWRFVESSHRNMRKYFSSDEAISYTKYAAAARVTPSFSENLAIKELIKNKVINPQEDLIINGQSGDFISGGHIPKNWESIDSWDKVWKELRSKHYSLWPDAIGEEEDKKLCLSAKQQLNIKNSKLHPKQAASLLEEWEYQERQSKYVVNAQRLYDFYEIDWWLPFWDKEYVEFWQSVSIEDKVGQSLYIKQLREWNYQNLFTDFSREIWGWPGKAMLVVPIQKAIHLTLGNKMRNKFVKTMRYIGLYGYQFGAFSFFHFFKYAQKLRNPVSLFALDYLVRNCSLLPSKLLKK